MFQCNCRSKIYSSFLISNLALSFNKTLTEKQVHLCLHVYRLVAVFEESVNLQALLVSFKYLKSEKEAEFHQDIFPKYKMKS